MPKLCNKNCILQIIPQGSWIPNGTFSFEESDVLEVSGSKCIKKVNFTPSGCVLAGATWTSGSSPGIFGSSQKIKDSGNSIVLDNQEGVCSGTFMTTTNPPTPIPCSCKLKIINPGQQILEEE